MRVRMMSAKSISLVFLLMAVWPQKSQGQADLPFRDPKLSDDARIADLLGRLTLEEKVDLMSDHPKIPRLGIIFSGQVEGLHGLALGGPGGWGPRGRQPLPTSTFTYASSTWMSPLVPTLEPGM